MTERRFNEAEVAAIFERAAEAQQTGQRQLPSGEGMTLAQLQEIGREVGIAPEQVAHAASALDRLGDPTSRRFLGLPIGVGRTIQLDRKLTDEEWERLVVDLRETFDARGVVRQEGSLRQWTNGNLQALLEPTATGHRLRLKTIKGDVRSVLGLSLGMIGVAGAAMIARAFGYGDPAMTAMLASVAIGSGIVGTISALRLPSWAKIRRRQMEDVAGRLTAQARSLPPDSSGALRRPDT
jgi:hypothetical protein